VHDDAIQTELTNLTNGQLEFTATPFVKSFRPEDNRQSRDRDNRGNTFGGDYRNKRNQKFQQRSGNRNNDRNNDRGGNKFKKKRF